MLTGIKDEVRRSAFVLRIWRDENGRSWDQVSQTVSSWQRPFTGVDGLCQLLLMQMFTHIVIRRQWL